MNLLKSFRSATVVAMLLSAGVANAGLYQFELTGNYSASWQLDSTVVPDFASATRFFALDNVDGRFPGSLAGQAGLTFYGARFGGGMEIYDFQGSTLLLVTDGPQLYSGPESNPTFRLGTFGMTQVVNLGSGIYTLTVTDLDAAPVDVPEPATSAMLLAGLGLLYASAKRRLGK